MAVSNGGNHRWSINKQRRLPRHLLNILTVTTLIALRGAIATDIEVSPVEDMPSIPDDDNLGDVPVALLQYQQPVSPSEPLLDYPIPHSMLSVVSVAALVASPIPRFSPQQPRSPPPSPSPSKQPQPPTPRSPGPQPPTSRSPGPQPPTSRSPGPQPPTPRSPGPQPPTSRSSGPQPPTSRSPGPQPPTSRSPGPQPPTSRSPGPQPPRPGPSKPYPHSPPVPSPLRVPLPPPLPKPSPSFNNSSSANKLPTPSPPSPSPINRRSPPPSPLPPPMPPPPSTRPPNPRPSPPPPRNMIPSLPFAPPEPCTACISFILEKTFSPRFDISFSWMFCHSIKKRVTHVMQEMAETVSVVPPLGDPTAITCTDALIMICFTFESAEEGSKLEWLLPFSNLTEILRNAVFKVLGEGSCDGALAGYSISMVVGGDDPENPRSATACLQYEADLTCAAPNGTCLTEQGATPFGAQKVLSKLPGRTKSTVLYCFETTAAVKVLPTTYRRGHPTDNKHKICNNSTSLSKVEIWADDSQRNAVKGIGVQPSNSPTMKFMTPSWGAPGTQTLVANQLDWTLEQADGGKICIELKKRTDLKSFCCNMMTPACWINLFDPTGTCCPVFQASLETEGPPAA
ncbi:hypothetical protein Vretifemale_13966 [Volvox reticuliferus]|uniref:Pherophorin domain-containing protein n=1 Tax=Volvox reticuliferus TaxID=1737510 RepID=A0A8J4FR36_9CHLO|nr:hypothetical protein Vretifemale_13966 [Volvox reticuliferus]